jgi:hypothetical protein
MVRLKNWLTDTLNAKLIFHLLMYHPILFRQPGPIPPHLTLTTANPGEPILMFYQKCTNCAIIITETERKMFSL